MFPMISKRFALLAISIFSPMVGWANSPDLASPAMTEALEQARKADKIPGITFAVFTKSGILIKGQVGTMGLPEQGLDQPVNADESIFRIGSVSKLFTTMAVTSLIDKGLLGRNAKLMDLKKTDVVKILRKKETPERLQNWNQIEIHHLISHQSGISKDTAGSLLGFNSESLLNHSYPSLEVMRNNLTQVEFLFQPGQIDTHFKYSNLAFNILARVVEAYNPHHAKYSDYMDRSLLHPLGMGSTFFDMPEKERSRMVQGYGSLLANGSRTTTPRAYFAGSYTGSMGVASTAVDLSKLGTELLRVINGESKMISNPEVIGDMLGIKSLASPSAGWASGPFWTVLPNENMNDDIWFGHQGTGASERASLLVNAERNLGVAVLFNCSDAAREKYVQLILKQLKIERPELFLEKVELPLMAREIIAKARTVLSATPVPANLTPAPYPPGLDVQKYVGKYEADLVGALPVTIDPTTGHLVFMGQKLAYEGDKGEGHFRMPPVPGPSSTNSNKEPIVFNFDSNGKVVSFKAFRIAIFRKVE